MSRWSLGHLDYDSGRFVASPLPLDQPGSACRVALQSIPGASGLQILVIGNEVSVRAEAVLSSGFETRVEWTITWLRSGALRLDAGPGTPVLFFPGGSEYEPPPLLGGRTSGELDLLFIVDATCRMHDSGHAPHRLAQPDAGGLYLWLEALAQELACKYSPASFGVLAFADDPLPDHASATDLVPAELFQPRSFEGPLPFTTVEALKRGFRCLRASTGVDWVDALAEALALCRKWAGWRPNARKLLVVCGDSPGHSALHPAETECDAHSRMATVEEECHRLHLQGVEIATLFTGPSADAPSLTAMSHRMVEHARAHYRRLASLPIWAWDEQTFEGNGIALLSSPPRWLARGTAYGYKLEVGPSQDDSHQDRP